MVTSLIKLGSKIVLFMEVKVVRHNGLNFKPKGCRTIDLIQGRE